MNISAFNVIDKTCLAICIIATLCFTSYCLYRYGLDDDTSRIHFKNYQEASDDIYPALTLCFKDYIIKSAFNNNNKKLKDYKSFLMGLKESDVFENLDYENVTLNISRYIIEMFLTTQDDEVEEDDDDDESAEKEIDENQGNQNENFVEMNEEVEDKIPVNLERYMYVAATVIPSHKCWTFEIPYMANHTAIQTFSVRLNGSVFKNYKRPKKDSFMVVISYPGQFLSARVIRSDWKVISQTKNDLKMTFNIQNMIALKKRNKFRETCSKESKKDDENKLRQIVQLLGCNPLHFQLNTTFPRCTIKNSKRQTSSLDLNVYDKPCRQIEKILYSYDEYYESFTSDNATDYEILLNFQGKTYMEIEQAKAYDFQSLIGNGGGYVGVFLGVALLQLPTFLFKSFEFIQNLFHG